MIQIRNRYSNVVFKEVDAADLRAADLQAADLRGANLRGAKTNNNTKITPYNILPEGNLIGYKKLSNNIICKLKIPAKAKRVCTPVGRKCRAEYAIVISGTGDSKINDYGTVHYAPGKKVKPDSYDPDWRVECSHGIHFFITKQEAIDFE